MKLSDALPTSTADRHEGNRLVIGVLTGEGVGPEIVPIALDLLSIIADAQGIDLDLRHGGLIGKPAIARHGTSLSSEVVSFTEKVFADGGALFCGAGGDRFVYELRARFDLFCKFTPLRPQPCLHDTGVIRPETLHDIDIVCVRENTGGMYLGEWNTEHGTAYGRVARHRFAYREDHVERIIDTALRLASMRRGHLTVTTKPGGVPAISALWQDVAERRGSAAGIKTRILEIDNAAYQLIADPAQFDVIVSPNMFGDVMADCGALLLGSRGLSYSGNFAPDGCGVFQTGHGAAHDLAGTDRANPAGQMLSLAMMLRESFGLTDAAQAVEQALSNVLASGLRTPDVAGPTSRIAGTREFGRQVCDELRQLAASLRPAGHRAA